MWIVVGIAAGLGIAVLCLAVKYRMLIKCIRQAGQDLAAILDSPQENRILLAVCPSPGAELLLQQINRYIEFHQRERIIWQQQERQLQEQIENISHDLRTPLTSILGYLELLDGSRLSGEDQEALEVVEKKSRYLQRLICDFYDLSRLEKADLYLQRESVEISRLIRETVLPCYPEFEKRHLEVDLALPETAVFIVGNQEALERILHNMIQNALRYARSHFRISVYPAGCAEGCGKETGEWQEPVTGYAEEKHLICLDFSNDTENLAQTDISCLFDRFYMADHARPGAGTGLGLTISRLLTEAMGGTVAAQLTEQGELHLIFAFQTETNI